MRIATIVGARPQFIKAAVVSRAIREHNRRGGGSIEEVIVHTGQHYDDNMSKVFFEELDIPRPAYNLGIHGSSHSAMTGRMMESLERIFQELRPDWVLVYGDTNSTMAGALAAKKLHLRLTHAEAGLRSFNMKMPEEQNRLVADRLADLLFCPTQTAVSNLAAEGIGNSRYGERVVQVGDVMYDAAIFYAGIAETSSFIIDELCLKSGGYALATIHRAENTDDVGKLGDIFTALNHIGKELRVVVPLHPRTKMTIEQHDIKIDAVTIIPPVSYLDMVMLEKHCRLVLTDSGGVQKEAFFFEKPCLTLRGETEWTELVQAGVNFLVGSDRKVIIENFKAIRHRLLDFSGVYYGNGKAGEDIIAALIEHR